VRSDIWSSACSRRFTIEFKLFTFPRSILNGPFCGTR